MAAGNSGGYCHGPGERWLGPTPGKGRIRVVDGGWKYFRSVLSNAGATGHRWLLKLTDIDNNNLVPWSQQSHFKCPAAIITGRPMASTLFQGKQSLMMVWGLELRVRWLLHPHSLSLNPAQRGYVTWADHTARKLPIRHTSLLFSVTTPNPSTQQMLMSMYFSTQVPWEVIGAHSQAWLTGA